MENFTMESTFPCFPVARIDQPALSLDLSSLAKRKLVQIVCCCFCFPGQGCGGESRGEKGVFYVGNLCPNFTLKIEKP